MIPSVELSWVAALLVGLFGSMHCAAMCGGIVGALTLALPAGTRARPRALFPFILAYNAGRIASYTAAGALVGALGTAVGPATTHSGLRMGHLLSALFMIAVGLYIAGWWQGLRRLEAAGTHLWQRIEPFGRRFLPVQRPAQAFALGIVWGWLPCGLVYSALVFAMATADPWAGATRMLAFGIGTLPMLLAMDTAGRWLNTLRHRPLLRQTAGGLVIVIGLAGVVGGSGHLQSILPTHGVH